MIELELLGTSADGESLVLTDAQGERYSVLISDELRGATRDAGPAACGRDSSRDRFRARDGG